MSLPSPKLDRVGSADGDRPRTGPAGGAAHDLKNLLAVMMGVYESLADGLDPRSERAELARVGLLAVEKAERLIERLRTEGAAPPPARQPEANVETVKPGEGQGRTVLVVEDDADLLKLMTAAFARAGYRAYSAQNGRLAVQLLGALKPDLMVTDIVMPEKEGIATIIEAKAIAPDTAVIAISGGGAYGRTCNFLQWAEQLGADEAMAKPFPMSQLLSAARVVLDRRAAQNAARAVAE
ncbi:MAG: response regulator [Phenylobacterium sp.]|nr:response regulator [Phenylobacterium sp.]